ncbi:MAG: methyltransferase domain-containing protein [Elusimicrobia bacterium]|nr:methyltransferase domain-containing protein [Elusimicrobiota bacterium]
MRRMYQTEWHGIQFSEFSRLSSRELAGPEFYGAFYREFFKRYRGWEQLSKSWREGKELWARFVLSRAPVRARVLSIGCGLGAVEREIQARRPGLELFIQEVAPAAWRWVSGRFPEDRQLLGGIPGCLPRGLKFDLIYLAAVDYALDDGALAGLLAALRPFLKAGGRCLIISASFDDLPSTLRGRALGAWASTKALAAEMLASSGLRSRGQLWGWSRSREDYRSVMRQAGYQGVEDGFVLPDRRAHYWIAGS